MTGTRLQGKIAVITGGGSGIGAAIAEAFCQEGATVVIADISGEEKGVASRLGERCTAVSADVTVDSQVQDLIRSTVAGHGRLDILCNNAGIDGRLAPLAELTEDDYDRVMAVNAKGVFLGMRHAIPVMAAAGGGSIINTASIASSVAFPTMTPYCASKGAVLMMTRTAAAEYASAGIRVNCICPGVTDTALVQQMPREIIAGATAMTPFGRMGRPDEMAGAAVFLASDEASFVTGASITVDGGYTAL